jgi:hypothetical protein
MGKCLNQIKRGRISRGAGLVCLPLVVLLSPGPAAAASKTWDGGCGRDTAWSCAGNWGGDIVPGPADTATFSAKSPGDSTVDPAFPGVVAAIRTNYGYGGTIALGRPLTVSKAFSQRSGAFDAGGEDLTVKAFTLSGGTFVASSGTTSVGGALKISGTPSFDANGGTVDFNRGGGMLSCNGVVFNLVTFSHTTGTKTVSGNCDLPLGKNPDADSGGSIKLNGALSGEGTLTTSKTLTLGSTGSLSGFSGLDTGSLAVNGKYDFGAYTTFDVARAFALSSGGSFTAPAGIASFAGNFTLNEDAGFDANGGTITFDGTAAGRLSCANKAFNLVSFAHTSGNKAIGSNCSLPLGDNPTLGDAGGASVSLSGALTGTGTLETQRTFVMSDTSSLSGFSGLIAQSGLAVNGATADFDSYRPFVVHGNYSQTGGTITAPDGADFNGQFTVHPGSTFNAPRGTATVAYKFTVDPGATFNPDGGTITFDGGHSAAISCGGARFDLVRFSHLTGNKTVGSDCELPLGRNPDADNGGAITLNGTLTGAGTLTTSGMLTLGSTGSLSGFSGLDAASLVVNGRYDFGAYTPFAVGGTFALSSAGRFTAPAGIASFAGDFVNGGDGFIANGGTVVLTGVDQQLTGDTTFEDLTKSASSAATLIVTAGNAITIRGTLTLEGAGGKELLGLASSAPGKPWMIEAAGARKVQLVSVADSVNEGRVIPSSASVDRGGNVGWSFSESADELIQVLLELLR